VKKKRHFVSLRFCFTASSRRLDLLVEHRQQTE